MGRYDFEGFASGWFVVGFSTELAPGELKPLRYFAKDLVLFRTEQGKAHVLDAHCPHMGAHLGHPGTVVGDTVRCPFHAWRFDGSGDCVDIPYASKIPKRARVDCWPVCERNGVIFVWHDAQKAPPAWEVPLIEQVGAEGWTAWNHGLIEVKSHPREIVENVVDVGHFIPVHGTHVASITNEFDAHRALQLNSGTAYPLGGGKDHYSLTATYHGPAFQITDMKGYLNSVLLNAHTPIEQNLLHLRFGVMVEQRPGVTLDQEFLDRYVENLRGGFFQDIEIWEHMRFRDRPILCEADGPLIQLRRWYSQFYEAPAQESARG